MHLRQSTRVRITESLNAKIRRLRIRNNYYNYRYYLSSEVC